MKIVSNCPLCEEHSLHIIGENELQTQQCINCGYVTAEKYKLGEGGVDKHEEYNKLTDEMKGWIQVHESRIWLPTIMTLPLGMLYPINVDNMVNHQKEMKWAFAEMVDIPEEEQKDYPDGNGGFYSKRFDTDNNKIYDTFLEAISILNKEMKQKQNPIQGGIKLPKLKKVKK
tara:strand:+ start:251 stop:766 length:516 start_codon:yes stop_codon:yes gene_type:complete